MRSIPRVAGAFIAAAAIDGLGCGGGAAPDVPPDASTLADADASVSAIYGARGPFATGRCLVADDHSECTDSGDASSAAYVIFYPVGPAPVHAPILTWGNGTDAAPDQYSVLLTQLASWGFAVVASTSANTGTGEEMLAGEDYLVAANADPASRFHDALDVAHIGAIGHSQGSDGAAHALLGADAPASPASPAAAHAFIATLVSIEPPGQQWTCFGSSDASCPAEESFDASSLRYGSVFFVDGSADVVIAPPTQSAATVGEQSVAAYFAATPATTPRAKATLIGADHNDIQDHCAVGAGCAGVGPAGYLGSITAWLRYQLGGDATAGLRFRGPSPEIDHDRSWEDATQAALPE